MTRPQAHSKAGNLWLRVIAPGRGWAVGDRIPTTTLRRRSTPDRCEVGYRELVSLTPERWEPTVMGRGATWEQAFERATRRTEQQAEMQRGML